MIRNDSPHFDASAWLKKGMIHDLLGKQVIRAKEGRQDLESRRLQRQKEKN